MNLELFIARRLYGTRKGVRHISRPAVAIAQWGVTIGAVIMIASICIIVGFKQQVREKVFGFGGHVQMMTYNGNAVGESPLTIDDEFMERLGDIRNVATVQQYVQKTGIIMGEKEYEGVVVKGIGKDYDLSFIESHIIEGTMPTFCDTTPSGSIVISRLIAEKIGVKTGDRINIYFLDKGIKARKLTIGAIYNTHLNEFDAAMAYTDIYTTRGINDWENDKVSGIEIRLDDYSLMENTVEDICDVALYATSMNEEQIIVPTIEELNPAMFAWLGVLDQTVWMILILVVMIAAFTMISGLLIIILEKGNLIGILKAVGAKNVSIRKIFIYYAGFIIGKGLIIGNIIGIGLCLLQQHFKIVAVDPEMYYMDRVPIEFTWLLVPMNIAMFVISVAALVLPSMIISRIEPTKAIKFE
ncbi:MAG: ABC transporter permease [Bacteroidaceae bacterium]|nr:ABC transporter permease [Bacteroidaceae bacterium]